MKIDNSLKDALKNIEDMTPEQVIENLRKHHLLDSYTISLSPELIGPFDEELLARFMAKLFKYAKEHNQVLIVRSNLTKR